MTFLWTDSIWIKGTIKFTPTNKIALIMLCVNLLCVIEQSIPAKIQNSVTPSRLNSATLSTGFLRYYAGYALLIQDSATLTVTDFLQRSHTTP